MSAISNILSENPICFFPANSHDRIPMCRISIWKRLRMTQQNQFTPPNESVIFWSRCKIWWRYGICRRCKNEWRYKICPRFKYLTLQKKKTSQSMFTLRKFRSWDATKYVRATQSVNADWRYKIKLTLQEKNTLLGVLDGVSLFEKSNKFRLLTGSCIVWNEKWLAQTIKNAQSEWARG